MIKTHKELAAAIKGKRILHLNSLGKDAILCLEWLNYFAEPSQIISVYYKIDAAYPTDERYWKYLQRRYPKTQFIQRPNTMELNDKIDGLYQSPVLINHVLNALEYSEFDHKKVIEELRVETNCDYVCSGMSKYEGMGRAIMFKTQGLLHEKPKKIFPIGLMTKKQIFELLKKINLRINPSYRFAAESHDQPGYYKMKYAFDFYPEYKKVMYEHYPLLRLDEYRYEVLLNAGNKEE